MPSKKDNDKNHINLVIVESPAKAKTIGKILGPEFKIESSVGHVRDLPPKGIGVNTRKDFQPTYEIVPGKEKVIDRLSQAAKGAKKVYLATDPDREGEAIAWHLKSVLAVPEKRVARVRFNEITKDAIQQAFRNSGDIDEDRVSAQQARRILDRLVGYKVSPLVQRKMGGRSAGRVQSVAVRLICEREEEIEAFEPQEYWTFQGDLTAGKVRFKGELTHWQGQRLVTPDKSGKKDTLLVDSQENADAIRRELAAPRELTVKSVKERTASQKPPKPFITSTLQRAAASAYGFGVKKTMQIAQNLYEGIEISKGAGPVGLITYMRTDSTRISDTAKREAADYIESHFGADYLGSQTKPKGKQGAQDAHEAIRPTYADKDPDQLKQSLTSDQYKLYRLIWGRFMASQMAPASYQRVAVEFTDPDSKAILRASSSKLTFPGFRAAYGHAPLEEDSDEEEPESTLPELSQGQTVKLSELYGQQHFTEPPPRYNEASLVKTLEERGVGRPSTYASIVSTIQERKYVEKNDSKALVPTKLGREVNRTLVEHFGHIFQTDFTARMESQLDEVEQAKVDWQRMLREFYEPFKGTLKEAQEKIATYQEETDIDCPSCGHKMMIKIGRYGRFLGCSQYPECQQTLKLTKDGEPAPPDRPSGEECQKCGTEMMIKHGRYGEYMQCPNDDCRHRKPILVSTGLSCPKSGCQGFIAQRKSRFGKTFYGCSEWSETGCDAVYWNHPVDEPCPKCGTPYLVHKSLKRGDKIACPRKECDYERLVDSSSEQETKLRQA